MTDVGEAEARERLIFLFGYLIDAAPLTIADGKERAANIVDALPKHRDDLLRLLDAVPRERWSAELHAACIDVQEAITVRAARAEAERDALKDERDEAVEILRRFDRVSAPTSGASSPVAAARAFLSRTSTGSETPKTEANDG